TRRVLGRRRRDLRFGRLGHLAEHVAVHPVEQRLVLGAPMTDRSDHRSDVRGVREAEHLRWDAVDAEHGEELLRLLGWAAEVGLVLQEERWGCALVRVGDRRAAPVHVFGLVWGAAELAGAEVRSYVACAVRRQPG